MFFTLRRVAVAVLLLPVVISGCGPISDVPTLATPGDGTIEARPSTIVLSRHDRMRAMLARAKQARVRQTTAESYIRVYDENGGIVKEFRLESDSAVSRSHTLPADLLQRSLDSYLTETPSRSNLASSVGVVELRAASWSETIGGSSVSFVDSTASDFGSGVVGTLRNASDDDFDYVGQFEFSDPAIIDSLDLASSLNVILPVGPAYAEVFLTGTDFATARREYLDLVEPYLSLREETSGAGALAQNLSHVDRAQLETRLALLDDLTPSDFVEACLVAEADCGYEWFAYGVKSAAAIVATGAMVAACLGNPIARFLTCTPARVVAGAATAAMAEAMSELVLCLLYYTLWPFD